jgi:polyhydroxyalkanoate synthesis repressor PhaR
MSEPIEHIIRKYSNRKLYDTLSKRYVTLQDIARLIRKGYTITVIEKDTGKDITSLILSQVLTTEEKKGSLTDNLNEANIVGLLQQRGSALLEYLKKSFNLPVEILTNPGKSGQVLNQLTTEAISQALEHLNIATREDLNRLAAKVEELSRRIEELEIKIEDNR